MSDLISRQDAIEICQKYNGYGSVWACIMGDIKLLPSAQPVITCDGCRFVGTYDTDFPCCGCVRREKDYYEPER